MRFDRGTGVDATYSRRSIAMSEESIRVSARTEPRRWEKNALTLSPSELDEVLLSVDDRESPVWIPLSDVAGLDPPIGGEDLRSEIGSFDCQ